MPHTPSIDNTLILRAINPLERRSHKPILDHLDAQEPALTEHLTEILSLIHRDLLNLGGPAGAIQRTYRRIEHLTLVCILVIHPSLIQGEMSASANDDEP